MDIKTLKKQFDINLYEVKMIDGLKVATLKQVILIANNRFMDFEVYLLMNYKANHTPLKEFAAFREMDFERNDMSILYSHNIDKELKKLVNIPWLKVTELDETTPDGLYIDAHEIKPNYNNLVKGILSWTPADENKFSEEDIDFIERHFYMNEMDFKELADLKLFIMTNLCVNPESRVLPFVVSVIDNKISVCKKTN